ncbi:MAG: hypothetical protein NZ789_16425, partial [Pseudomonadales bacterium]|nr:hypothetical protein [Pseudomonadales bacterium]
PETVEQALTPAAEGMRGMQMGMIWMLDKVGERGYNIQHGGAHMYGWHNWGIAWPELDTALVYATNHWPVPDIPPDVTLVRNFVETWLLYDTSADVADRRSGADWHWKLSYVRGVFFTAAFNYAIAIPTEVSDKQIDAAVASASINPDFAASQANWVPDAFVQGAKDLRSHGTTAAAVNTFFDDNPNLTREEFRLAYAEIGGMSYHSGLFSHLFKPPPEPES